MNATNHPLKSTLLTAAAALLCTGLQFAGIDSLAAPRSIGAEASIVQLPLVVVTAQRESEVLAVQQLPQVVVIGRRLDLATATAQSKDDAAGTAI